MTSSETPSSTTRSGRRESNCGISESPSDVPGAEMIAPDGVEVGGTRRTDDHVRPNSSGRDAYGTSLFLASETNSFFLRSRGGDGGSACAQFQASYSVVWTRECDAPSGANMTQKKLVVVGIIVLGLVALFGWPKVSAWIAVAGESVAKQIDKALGEYKVKEAEIERGLKTLEESLAEVRVAEIRTRKHAERLEEKLQKIQLRVDNGERALKSLREGLRNNEPVKLGAKVYATAAEKQDITSRLLPRVNSLSTELSSYRQVSTTLRQTVDRLEGRHTQGLAKLQQLRTQLDIVRARLGGLQALQESAKIIGDGDQTLGDKFESVQRELDSLTDDLTAKLTVEQEKWAHSVDEPPGEVDDILKKPSVDDTLKRIDDLLGERRD